MEEEDDSIQEPTWSPMSAAQAFSAVFSQARAKLQLFRASQRYVDGSLRIADLSSQRSDQRRERQALQAISHAEMLLGTSVAIRSHLDLEHRNPTMAARAGRSLASIAHNTAGPVYGTVRAFWALLLRKASSFDSRTHGIQLYRTRYSRTVLYVCGAQTSSRAIFVCTVRTIHQWNPEATRFPTMCHTCAAAHSKTVRTGLTFCHAVRHVYSLSYCTHS